jgi:hypothetical protein
MVQGTSLIVLTCLCLGRPIVAAGGQEDRQLAETLWEQAIAAKGGRDRLAGIRSFAILEKTRFRGFMTRDVATGRVDQIVCELPDQWWEFLDYRPGLMGYSVEAVNTRTGLGWVSPNGAPARPFLRPHTNPAYRLRQLQYVYFLETRSVRPRPLRASRVRLGFRTVDRVDTAIDDERVVFYLDVKTHLPLRIETVRKVVSKPPRPGVTGTGELRYRYELDGYHEVAGIQVPARRKLGGGGPVEVHIEINPEYEPSVFTAPPPSAGIDSWRKRAEPK